MPAEERRQITLAYTHYLAVGGGDGSAAVASHLFDEAARRRRPAPLDRATAQWVLAMREIRVAWWKQRQPASLAVFATR